MTRYLLLAALAASPFSALADAAAGEKKAQLCILCHRAGGMGAPLLEGMPQQELIAAVRAYQAGQRSSPAMDPNVARLSRRDLADIAAYFASRPRITKPS